MSIKKSISFTFGAQVINTIIGFITSIIITRILGPEGRGEQAIFTNSIAFAVLFFGFSINSTIIYFINSGKAKANELLSTIIIFIICSTFLVYATLFVLEHLSILHLALPNSIQSFQYKLIFTGVYFILLLNGVLSTYLIAYKKFKAVSIYTIISQILPLSLYILLYFNIINYISPLKTVVLTTALTTGISAIALIQVFYRLLPIRPVKKLIPFSLVKQFILFSSMAYIGNVATFFSYRLDFWIIDKYCGKSELGIYSLASQLAQLLWVLPSAIASVLYTYASNSSKEEAIQYTIKLKQVAFYATLTFAICGLLLFYYFIPILYGQEFMGVFNLIAIFYVGVVPFSIASILASLNAARGNFKISFFISLIIFFLSAVLYNILIPSLGLKGGALASAIAYLTAAILAEIWFCKVYKVSIFNLFNLDKQIFLKAANILSKKFK